MNPIFGLKLVTNISFLFLRYNGYSTMEEQILAAQLVGLSLLLAMTMMLLLMNMVCMFL